jgi:hypothetical protein
MKRFRSNRRGASLLEFTLVGLPAMFTIISVFEMSRGVWMYQTLAHAVREGTRYTAVHSENCANWPNTCGATVGSIAAKIQQSGGALMGPELTLTFSAGGNSVSCAMNDCLQDVTQWPPVGANTRGMDVDIRGEYVFRSTLAMFWPGAGRGMNGGVFRLPASSREKIQF